MPTNRHRVERAQRGVTPELLEAWRAGDRALVRRLTNTKPWMISPLDAVSGRPDGDDRSPWAASWPRALEWRKRLSMIAGPPGPKPNDADK
jgi:hypothetical protein